MQTETNIAGDSAPTSGTPINGDFFQQAGQAIGQGAQALISAWTSYQSAKANIAITKANNQAQEDIAKIKAQNAVNIEATKANAALSAAQNPPSQANKWLMWLAIAGGIYFYAGKS